MYADITSYTRTPITITRNQAVSVTSAWLQYTQAVAAKNGVMVMVTAMVMVMVMVTGTSSIGTHC